VYQVRQRVLRERLADIVARAEERHDEECARLAGLGLALLERHEVDGRGRCRQCPRRRWRRRNRCAVLALVSFYLEQSQEFLTSHR
jgi:hypothetical protein